MKKTKVATAKTKASSVKAVKKALLPILVQQTRENLEVLNRPKVVIEAPTGPTYKSAPAPQGASEAGYHELEPIMECEKKYELLRRWRIGKPQIQAPNALAVGGLFHAGRAWWYNNKTPTGPDAWKHLEDHVRETAQLAQVPIAEEAITATLRYLDQYCTHWSVRVKPEIIGTEYALAGELWSGLGRTARLDDVGKYVEGNGQLCIGECKTTSVNVADVVNEYKLHGQPLLQMLLWRIDKNGEATHGPVRGVLLDVVVKGYGKERCQFGRQFVPVSEFALGWAAQSFIHFMERAKLIKDGAVRGVRNPKSCTRFSGRMRIECPFRDLCIYGRKAGTAYVDGTGTSILKVDYQTKERPWD